MLIRKESCRRKRAGLFVARRRRVAAAALAAAVGWGSSDLRAADTWIWTGGSGNFDWSDGANWNHPSGSSTSVTPVSAPDTSVDFAGLVGTTPNQNIASPMELNSLGFNSGASAFVLTGSGL